MAFSAKDTQGNKVFANIWHLYNENLSITLIIFTLH